jgi:predicted transcriptional regulator
LARQRRRGQEAPPALDYTGAPIYLISIRPVYAFQIFRGVKKFELRRGVAGNIPEGAVMVVYASGNVRAIIGEFRVGRVIRGTAEHVWQHVTSTKDSGIGSDAWRYIRGADRAMALEVQEPTMYPRRVTLEEIRRIIPGWNPPLSYKQLREGEPLYELIIRKLRALAGREPPPEEETPPTS